MMKAIPVFVCVLLLVVGAYSYNLAGAAPLDVTNRLTKLQAVSFNFMC
jgi:hypothetical protein